ncbi:PHP domain-containing protein, partial [Clostridium perfringens]|nr:PHP domain-containing protein [Clostridium perfringens]
VDQEDFINTKGIFALEIYNHGTVLESNTGYDTIHWDTMLRNGNRVFGFASDDNHNEDFLPDSCGGWIMVNAESLEHDNIINALLEGNYYSSSGPEIYDFGIKDGVAYVECSPVNHVHFMSGNAINGGFSYWGEPKEDSVTKAEFKLRGNETYIRIECVDKYGKKAWSNPIFID